MSVLGFNVNIKLKNKECIANVYVVKSNGPLLLSRNWIKLLKIEISGIDLVELPNDVFVLYRKYKQLFSEGTKYFNKGEISLIVDEKA